MDTSEEKKSEGNLSDENASLEVPEVKSKEDAIADLADLEKMVTDIAAELMDDDKEAK